MITADWISAAANVVLAASVVIGAILALSRWPVGFAVRNVEGPFFGEVVIEGVTQPKTTSWICDLALLRGDIAHVASVQLERRVLGVWQPVRGGCAPREDLPVSLENGATFSAHFAVDRNDSAEFRIVIREYGTLRRLMFPFLKPRRLKITKE